jgi:hypothetical protein
LVPDQPLIVLGEVAVEHDRLGRDVDACEPVLMGMNDSAQSLVWVDLQNLLPQAEIQNDRVAVFSIESWNNNQRRPGHVGLDHLIDNLGADPGLIDESDQTRSRLGWQCPNAALDRTAHPEFILVVGYDANRSVAYGVSNLAVTVASDDYDFVDSRGQKIVHATFDEGLSLEWEELLELSHTSGLTRRKKNR